MAFVGLAKNTGKTVALGTLVAELSALGRPLAITSIGRDGEEFDVLHPALDKPPIHCPAGTLVATTAPLLRHCGAPHEVLVRTELRTPLGRVVIGRLGERARVEIAGPSSSAEIRGVVDQMLALGAEQAIVDGSIDRRAASAPNVSDAVIVSTGAVLGARIEEVVHRTERALELAGLPRASDPRLRELATRTAGRTFVVDQDGVSPLSNGFALTARADTLPPALRAGAGAPARTLVVGGVLPERLLEVLLPGRTTAPIGLLASDPTKVFVRSRSARWYRRRGLRIEVLDRVKLTAITVNPQAPLSHRLDSARLRAAIAEVLHERVPIVDVRARHYEEAWRGRAPASLDPALQAG